MVKMPILITVGVFMVFIEPIYALVYWITNRATLGMYWDVKLIRNKLYHIDGDCLIVGDKTDKTSETNGTSAQTYSDDFEDVQETSDDTDESNQNSVLANASKLRELKRLLDDGVLTQEEFDREKKKLL